MAIQEALKILAEFDDQASPQIKKLNEQLEAVNKGVDEMGARSEGANKKVADLSKGTDSASKGVESLGKNANDTGKKVVDLGKKADDANRGGLVGLRTLIRNLSFDFRGFAQGGDAAGQAISGLASGAAADAASSVAEIAVAATAAGAGFKAVQASTDALTEASLSARQALSSSEAVYAAELKKSEEAALAAARAQAELNAIRGTRPALFAYRDELDNSPVKRAPAGSQLAKDRAARRVALVEESKAIGSNPSQDTEIIKAARLAETLKKQADAAALAAKQEFDLAKATADAADAAEKQAIATARGANSMGLLGGAARLASVGLVAIVAAVEGLAVGVRSAADNASELADKLGVTVEKMEALSLLATENGGSVQGLVSVYDKLSKSLNKLDKDNEKAEESFAALGLQQKDLAGLSETEIAGKIIKNYELLGRSTEATAAVQQLLGASFREQIPSIRAAAEDFGSYEKRVRDYGAVAGPALIEAGGRQEVALSNLGLAFKGLGIQIAGFASESLTEIAQFAADAIKAFKDTGIAGKVIQTIYQTLAILFANVSFVLKAVGRELGGIAAQLVSLAKLDFKGFTAIGDAVTEDAKRAREELDALEQRILNPQAKVGSPSDVRAADNAIAAKAAEEAAIRSAAAQAKLAAERKKAAEEQLKLFQSAKEELQSQIRLAGDLTNAERVLAETIDGKYAKLSPKQKQELVDLARKLDAKEKEIELAKQLKSIEEDLNKQAADLTMQELEVSLAGKTVAEREKELDLAKQLAIVRKDGAGLSATQLADLEAYVKVLNERRAALRIAQQEADVVNKLIDGSEAAIMASIQANIQIAAKLLEQGKISVLDYTVFVQDELKKVKKANEEAASESSIFWQEAAKGIQGAMSSFFFDFMQGKLTNLGQAFKKVIDQMVAQALAAKLADALFGAGFASGKGGGNLGGYVGQAASFLGSIFGRETGGPVSAGQPYIVGEKRAELFVPDRNGTIVPSLDGLQNAGTNVTFQISAMDSQDVVRSIDMVSRQVADIVNGASGRYNLRGVR